jgi:hypothetical protein
MPSNVARFEQLMYLSIAIGVIGSALEWNRLVLQADPVGGAPFVLVVQGLVIASEVILIWLIARRRKNWARWLALISFLVGIPFGVNTYIELFQTNALVGILSTIQDLLQIIALYLIFTGNARDWFQFSSEPGRPATESISR